MRTVRCNGRPLGEGGVSVGRGGVFAQGGDCPGGPGRVSAQGLSAWMVSAQGGVCLGVCLPRGVSARPPTPVKRITDKCKTLPCRNYVADGNNQLVHF